MIIGLTLMAGAASAREWLDCPARTGSPLWLEAICELGNDPRDLAARASWGWEGIETDKPALEVQTSIGVLTGDGYFAQIWETAPGVEVAGEFDHLLAMRGLQPLSGAERAEIAAAAEQALAEGRYSPAGAAPPFRAMVKARGAKLLYLNTNGFLVVSEDQYCKWVNVRLLPNFVFSDWFDFERDTWPEARGIVKDAPDRNCEEDLLS